MLRYFFCIPFLIIFGCGDGKIITQLPNPNCYIIYPIYKNSDLETEKNMNNIVQLPYAVKIESIFDKKAIMFDSAYQYITSYRHQKRIFFNHECSLNLQYPDSCFLRKIFTDSEQTTLPISFSINFLKKEKADSSNKRNRV